MNYVYAASGAIILVFIFLILKKKKKAKADYLLITVNVLIGSFLLADVLVNQKLTSESVIFQNGVPLILFPVFVFYLLQFTHANKKISHLWYLIFLPFLIFCAYSFVDHFILNNYLTYDAIEEHFNAPSIWYQLIFKGAQLMFISILISLLRTLNRFEDELKKGYSSIETIEVKWLKHFTWIYLGSIAFTFVLFLGQNIGLIPFEIKQVFGIVYGILTISVFYLNYQGIQHYTLSQIHPTQTTDTIFQVKDSKEVEEKSSELTPDEKELEAQIIDTITKRQHYLEPKFSLNDLAEELGKSKHLISKIINAKEGRSFYDLVNGYRVEHLKKMMEDPKNDQFTILSMGLDSGFNSKASLNRIFKNFTGLTPKQFLDQRSQSIGSTSK